MIYCVLKIKFYSFSYEYNNGSILNLLLNAYVILFLKWPIIVSFTLIRPKFITKRTSHAIIRYDETKILSPAKKTIQKGAEKSEW